MNAPRLLAVLEAEPRTRTRPRGRSNRSPERLSATSLSSCSLLSFCVYVAHASISGVIVPAPPKMLNGTQPGVAAHTSAGPSASASLRALKMLWPVCEALLRPQFRLTSQ